MREVIEEEQTRFHLMKSLYNEFNKTASAKDKKALMRDMEHHRIERERALNQLDDMKRDLKWTNDEIKEVYNHLSEHDERITQNTKNIDKLFRIVGRRK